MQTASRPIGVFDSGLGGLTVLKSLKELLPNEQFIYYGDTAHLPYGEKSAEALRSYVRQISAFLKDSGCKLMVVACNSASTVLPDMDNLPFAKDEIIDVITPVVELIGSQQKYNNIAIIGTRKTIDSTVIPEGIAQLNPSLELLARKTPLLVPMIEEGFLDHKALFPVFDKYFEGFEDVELIVPACTHYPIIYDQIEQYFDKRLKVLHAPKVVAEKVVEHLTSKNLLNQTLTGEDLFHLSDLTDSFQREAEMFLGKSIRLQKTLLK